MTATERHHALDAMQWAFVFGFIGGIIAGLALSQGGHDATVRDTGACPLLPSSAESEEG